MLFFNDAVSKTGSTDPYVYRKQFYKSSESTPQGETTIDKNNIMSTLFIMGKVNENYVVDIVAESPYPLIVNPFSEYVYISLLLLSYYYIVE